MKNIEYLAIIPARGNSKRIKNKNLIKFRKKTLIENTLDSIKDIKKIELAALSSDLKKILKIGKKYKKCITIDRPKNISNSKSTTEQAILHVLKVLEKQSFKIKNIILLQVTSPLRLRKDIIGSIQRFEKNSLNSIFSCYKKKPFVWSKKSNFLQSISYNYEKRTISQEMENMYFENGAIYIFNVKKFKKVKNRIIKPFDLYLMDEMNSLDIDTKEDLKLLKKME